MYLIVNYDQNWKYERTFSNFIDAFKANESFGDINNIIEFIDDDGTKQVVWEKSYEEVDCLNNWQEMNCGTRTIQ